MVTIANTRCARINLSRGITLIELLVVLVIMGLLVSVAVLSTGLAGGSKRSDGNDALAAAEALSVMLEHASQLALAENAVLGLRVDERGELSWLRWQSQSWLAADESVLTGHTLPQSVAVQWQPDKASAVSDDAAPVIVFYPGRELSVFELHLRDKNTERASARVWPGPDGSIRWGAL